MGLKTAVMHLVHVRTYQYFIKPAEAHREMRMLGRCGAVCAANTGLADCASSGGPEVQHAVVFLGGQTPLDQHVIDMGDQLAGGKAHLVHVQHVLVEHHRH